MGMDVYGIQSTNKTGEYFRASVWSWRPIWSYVVANCSEFIDETTAQDGHANAGAGLDKEKSQLLSKKINELIDSGHAQAYKETYDEQIAVAKAWNYDVEALLGKLHLRVVAKGFHNRVAPRDYPETESHYWWKLTDMKDNADSYPFEIEHLKEFADFLEYSGGFEIW